MNDMKELELVLNEHLESGNVIKKNLDGIELVIEVMLKGIGYDLFYMNDEERKEQVMFLMDKHFFTKSIATNISTENNIIKQLKKLSERNSQNCLIIIKNKAKEKI